MTTRTFRQLGQGYGSVPVNITAKINGSAVYTGDVDTDPSEPPVLPDLSLDIGVPVFSWTNPDVDFEGVAYMEIRVNNDVTDDCSFYLTDTLANYIASWINATEQWEFFGPDTYSAFYFQTIQDEQGSWISGDPQTDVVIDGVPVEPHPVRTYPGQYYWKLEPQQTLTCTVNIQRGFDIPPGFDPNTSYVLNQMVSYNSGIYAARQDTTGNLPTDNVFWRQVGTIVSGS